MFMKFQRAYKGPAISLQTVRFYIIQSFTLICQLFTYYLAKVLKNKRCQKNTSLDRNYFSFRESKKTG